jgi:hypothetical protein
MSIHLHKSPSHILLYSGWFRIACDPISREGGSDDLIIEHREEENTLISLRKMDFFFEKIGLSN